MQSIESIVNEINQHIERLQVAKASLTGVDSPVYTMKKQPGKTPHAGRYSMNRVARERIAAAQRERWAKIRAAKEAEVQSNIADARSSSPSRKQRKAKS